MQVIFNTRCVKQARKEVISTDINRKEPKTAGNKNSFLRG